MNELYVLLIIFGCLTNSNSLSAAGDQHRSNWRISKDDTKLLFGLPAKKVMPTAMAKTVCNFNLSVRETSNNFNLDEIAVLFTVTVNDCNETAHTSHSYLIRNERAKFLLALPDDSIILSIKILNHGVKTSNIKMYPQNNKKCFQRLTSLCQDMVITATLYNTPEILVKQGQPVCFVPGEKKSTVENIEFRCCSWQENLNDGMVNCTDMIYPIEWVRFGIIAILAMSIINVILYPLLLKYLPTRDTRIVRRSRVNRPKQLGYSNYLTTPVNLSSSTQVLLTLTEPLSFATCGGDEAQPCFSRIGRGVILLVFPLIFCVVVVTFFITNNKAQVRTNVSYYTGFVTELNPPTAYYAFAIALFCLLLLGMLVVIPGRLSALGRYLSGRKDEKTFLGFPKPDALINNYSGKSGFQFMHSNMVFHLKCCFDLSFWLFILKIIVSPCAWLLMWCCCSTKENATSQSSEDHDDVEPHKTFLVLGFFFLPIILVLWIPFVLFCLVVYITPVGYVAFRIFRLLYKQDIPMGCNCCERLPYCVRYTLITFLSFLFFLFCTLVLASYVFLSVMFGISFYICGKIFLFTSIGLAFNVEYYIPYVVLALFVVFYFWRALSHYFFVYENLRIVVFEECEKYEQLELMNLHQQRPNNSTDSVDSTTPPKCYGLLLLDDNNTPSIPLALYVGVYRRLRPRAKTFLTIMIKFMIMLVYISIAFVGIMSLNEANDTSPYVQAAFLCALFALPLVLFQGCLSPQSRQRRKNLEYQVRLIIHRYVSKMEKEKGNVDAPVDASPEFDREDNEFDV